MNKMFTFMRESSIARFFIPLGVILIIFGVIIFVINMKNKNYLKIEATILDTKVLEEAYTDADGNHVDETYSATIEYTVDGKKYQQTLDNVSKYNVGDKMTIYYNPQDPNQITQSKTLIIPIVMIIAGITAVTGGIVSIVNAIKRHKKMKEQERSWANGQ